MVMEATSSVSYEDDQLPHKYTNPHLSMQEEQFIWQYVYAMIHREPSKYNSSDHQLLVRQVADLCAQALRMHDRARCQEAKPNPGKAVLHGIKSLPKCLTPEQPELGICARCGRTSKVRFAYPSVTGTLTDLATDYQELCNVPFCRKCTNTEQLHKSNTGVETASLCLQQDKYVQMPTGIVGVDAVKPAPQYLLEVAHFLVLVNQGTASLTQVTTVTVQSSQTVSPGVSRGDRSDKRTEESG